MEVKPGYKMTEVGVIPQDWDMVPLSMVTSEIGDGIHATPIYSATGDYFFINGNNLCNGKIVITDDTKTVDRTEFKKHGKNLGDRSILMSINGTIGNLGLFSGESVILGKSAAYLNVKDNFSKQFLYFSIQTEPIKRQFSDGLTGTTIRNLGLGTIRNTTIPLPPTKAEQKAIAEALSDADALIESLEQLITKKRRLKQGAMQKLLTGKKRLPGFENNCRYKRSELGMIPEDWRPTTIGDLAVKIGSGVTPRGGSSNYRESGRPFVRSQNVGWGAFLLDDMAFIDDDTHNRFAATELKLDDVLLNITGASIGRSTVVDARLVGGNVNQHVCIIRAANSIVVPKFVNYCLLSDSGQRQIDSFQAGGNREGLNFGQIRSLRLAIPTQMTEQIGIVQILDDIDAEIAALETRLSKARQIKQGMMQELLTGRIRLITSESVPKQSSPAPQKSKAHNWQFNEAVVISTLAKHFGDKQHPLGRKRYTKLSYLLHRHAERQAEGYLKQPAGPYNPKTRYAGPEKIALQRGYVCQHKNEKFDGFIPGENIAQAEQYFEKWYGCEALEWLEQFHYKTNDELELLATVDMAAEELRGQRKEVSVASVKKVIETNKQWKAKLSRDIFSDKHIASAIKTCETLFG